MNLGDLSNPDNVVYLQCALTLTQIQKNLIVGTMLGDATMESNAASTKARIRYQQTYPKHQSYILFLYNLLKNLVNTSPRIIARKPSQIRFIALLDLALYLLSRYITTLTCFILLWQATKGSIPNNYTNSSGAGFLD